MATVKITKDLIEQVSANARAIHGDRIHNVYKTLDFCGWTADSMLEFILGSELLDTLRRPEVAPFVTMANDLYLETINGVGAGIALPKPLAPLPFPKGRSTDIDITVDGTKIGEAVLTMHYAGSYVKLTAPPSLLRGLDNEVERVQAERSTLVQVQDEYLRSVRKVMESFSTLAPALKAWPALWELLPEVVRAKHKAVRGTAAARSAPVLDVDVNKLTAITAAHRMGI